MMNINGGKMVNSCACPFCEVGQRKRNLIFRIFGKLPISTLNEIKDDLKFRKIIK